MKSILISGFTPFDGELINPSWEAVRRLPETMEGVKLIKIQVPAAFYESGQILEAAIAQYQPDAVLCVGQAGGRAAITPEKVAINYIDARIPDNNGVKPVDVAILPDTPAAYFSSLPVRGMVEAIQNAGLPASLSYSAGTYVCNYLMYAVLHYAASKIPALQAGFVHVPFLPEQVVQRPGTPSMSLTDIISGLEACVRAIILPAQLSAVSLGTLD